MDESHVGLLPVVFLVLPIPAASSFITHSISLVLLQAYIVVEHLIVLRRTELNVGAKHSRTFKLVIPVSGGLLLVGWCQLC